MLVQIIEYISLAIGLVGIAVIIYGSIISFVKFLNNELKRIKAKIYLKDNDILRLSFGTYLLLGLEFLIAADIIRTILKPSLEEVAILGAIVAIRTVINYFLDIEIDEVQHHSDSNTEIKL
ncbi:MAG: DUF1622 domain-containing protein [Candidatus Methanofastidiosum sp.]|nr:DUF1622 domain-containing protein [Methanofastidiosum sp.]